MPIDRMQTTSEETAKVHDHICIEDSSKVRNIPISITPKPMKSKPFQMSLLGIYQRDKACKCLSWLDL